MARPIISLKLRHCSHALPRYFLLKGPFLNTISQPRMAHDYDGFYTTLFYCTFCEILLLQPSWRSEHLHWNPNGESKFQVGILSGMSSWSRKDQPRIVHYVPYAAYIFQKWQTSLFDQSWDWLLIQAHALLINYFSLVYKVLVVAKLLIEADPSHATMPHSQSKFPQKQF
jgi:hypothetical protein